MNELIPVQKETIGGETVNAVSARELHTFLEIGKDFSNWIKDRIEIYGFIDGLDFSPVLAKTSNGGRPSKEYIISLDMAKELSMVERNAKGKQARQYFIACEKELKSQQPAIPQTYIEALQALIESEKQKQLAIATKAEIGSRREATAMNTASHATKRASRLEIELDQAKEYCTIKRMQMIHHGQKFNWRELKAASAEMEIPPVKVFDQNYGQVNAYHVEAWRAAYAIDMDS